MAQTEPPRPARFAARLAARSVFPARPRRRRRAGPGVTGGRSCSWSCSSSGCWALPRGWCSGRAARRPRGRGAAGHPDASRVSSAGRRAGEPSAPRSRGSTPERSERGSRRIRQIAEVTVRRGWPTAIVITIRERVPVALVRAPAGSPTRPDGVDSPRRSKSRPGDLPLVMAAQPGPGDPATRSGLSVLRALPRRLSSRLVTVEATSPEASFCGSAAASASCGGAAERAPEKVEAAGRAPATKAGRLAAHHRRLRARGGHHQMTCNSREPGNAT